MSPAVKKKQRASAKTTKVKLTTTRVTTTRVTTTPVTTPQVTVAPELLKAVPGGWTLRPTIQSSALAKTYEALQKPGIEYVILEAPPGTGKCHGRGTPMLKFTGTVINVEDVKVGDLLMGPDSKPRKVLSTTTGVGPLFRIEPTKGTPWVCNEAHVLTLVHSESGEVFDLPLDTFLAQAKSRTHHQKLFHVGVEFHPQEPLPLDPYFFGIWLGDGSKFVTERASGERWLMDVCVTKQDAEIKEACETEASRWGLRVRVSAEGTTSQAYHLSHGNTGGGLGSNPLLTLLRSMVGDSTNIPYQYLTASRVDRLALLAGLLDTDGYLTNNCYEIVQKRRNIADAIVFLARGLGLQATLREKEVPEYGLYFRVFISGNTNQIPCRIPRKKAAPRQQKKDVTRTGFTVMPLGVGDYYGFTLDGDGRYLLGDFTVTHNSLCSITLGKVFGPAAIITATVQLQEQYLTDFSPNGLRVLKGQRNFHCVEVNDTCQIGKKLGCESICPFTLAKKDALESPLLTANYHSYWRHMPVELEEWRRVEKGEGDEVCHPALIGRELHDREIVAGRKIVICDEVHQLENIVLDLASVTIRLSDIPIGLPPLPEERTAPEPFFEWMDKAQPTLARLQEELESEGQHEDGEKVAELLRQIAMVLSSSGWLDGAAMRELKKVGGGTAEVKVSLITTQYILERGTDDAGRLDHNWFSLKPLHVRHIAKRFWQGFPKVLFMSATILNAFEFCSSLGLDPEKGEFVQIKESFPPENRPIMLGSLDMSYGAREESWPHMVRIIEGLMGHHSEVKGLILTQSNVMLKHLMSKLGNPHKQRLIPAFGDDRLEKYNEHLRAKYPSVLIASGYWEGADLIGDRSRFQIIPGLPRAMFTGQVAARAKLEPRWYRLLTFTKTLQGLGRSCRAESDECISYVLDIDFTRELARKDSMIPEWVRVAVKRSEGA